MVSLVLEKEYKKVPIFISGGRQSVTAVSSIVLHPDWKVCKMRTEGRSFEKKRTYTLAVSHLSHDAPQHLKSTQI